MINTVYYIGFLLVFLRIISIFIVSPVFFPKSTPKMVIIAFCGILSFIILPSIDYSNISKLDNGFRLIIYCFNEIATGIIIGYIIRFCFFMVSFAGQLVDIQIGFAMINMFDPQTGTNVTILSNLMYWISVVILLIVDGHHVLIKSFIESFSTAHLGQLVLTKGTSMLVIKAFIDFFAIGFKIAVPLILVIIITDLVLALVGRTVPQLNVMILGLPIKIIVGLLTISLALPIIIKLIVLNFSELPNIIRGILCIFPVFIVFNSEDKTEEATPKKKSDARKKGQIARSKEVGLAATLLASTIVLVALGEYIVESLRKILVAFLNNYINMPLDSNTLRYVMVTIILKIAIIILPVAIPIMLFGVAANLAQVGFLHTNEPLKPDLKKLNPISGFKKIFSIRSLIELVKDLSIVSVVSFVGYKYLKSNYIKILGFSSLKINFIPSAIKELVVGAFFKVTLIMIVISIFDYVFQRKQHNKELRMSKQEIKEEFKQDEGDPQIKGKIKQMQRQMASKRMMQSIPDATVVITNPTHISIAIKYSEGENAPIVVAKGQGEIALKIKEIAKEHDVPIIENKPLARLIYKEVDIDSEIPAEMYEAVAEILAVVFKLKGKKRL
ncbi:fused FliR family export protein/FlhB family type III secretion system protein [Haloimpatiens sp. FM7315]|uniref:fused FliR family export protein/FlhB family type III secretion system protein n=1 Tax=Haloimpatiens sp. FM7315 TaxID=3298609 RepID=UPI0035A27215